MTAVTAARYAAVGWLAAVAITLRWLSDQLDKATTFGGMP